MTARNRIDISKVKESRKFLESAEKEPLAPYGSGDASARIASVFAEDILEESEREAVRGVLPDRDLKRNLGCG